MNNSPLIYVCSPIWIESGLDKQLLIEQVGNKTVVSAQSAHGNIEPQFGDWRFFENIF
jgi:hypothetical protein